MLNTKDKDNPLFKELHRENTVTSLSSGLLLTLALLLRMKEERGWELEGLKSICVAYGLGVGYICPLYCTTGHSGLNLALSKARLSTHSMNSFERGLRRGWTDSFSQGGKDGKSACYGRPTVRQWRKTRRERLCFKLVDWGYCGERGNLQIASSVPVGQLTLGGGIQGLIRKSVELYYSFSENTEYRWHLVMPGSKHCTQI